LTFFLVTQNRRKRKPKQPKNQSNVASAQANPINVNAMGGNVGQQQSVHGNDMYRYSTNASNHQLSAGMMGPAGGSSLPLDSQGMAGSNTLYRNQAPPQSMPAGHTPADMSNMNSMNMMHQMPNMSQTQYSQVTIEQKTALYLFDANE
jgi:hypothetical protein